MTSPIDPKEEAAIRMLVGLLVDRANEEELASPILITAAMTLLNLSKHYLEKMMLPHTANGILVVCTAKSALLAQNTIEYYETGAAQANSPGSSLSS
jgi:hypothetical protein